MHSGLVGLGRLEGGLNTITDVFQDVLREGLLVIPSFTYSWCEGKPFDPFLTECPKDVGNYSQYAWKDKRFIRSWDPNFSVAALKNEFNGEMIEEIFNVGGTCFGRNSVFDHMYQQACKRHGHILLLGGAHSDAIFRTTFIHYVEEKVGVPSRYLKKFCNPENNNQYIKQLVRFLSEEEYRTATGHINSSYDFPIVSDYTRLGEDLIKEGLINRKRFGYTETRAVNIKIFCDFLERKLTQYPDYCVKGIRYGQCARG